jgi:hypothetical protein
LRRKFGAGYVEVGGEKITMIEVRQLKCVRVLVDGALACTLGDDHKKAYAILDNLDALIDALVKSDIVRFEKNLRAPGSRYPEIASRSVAAYDEGSEDGA